MISENLRARLIQNTWWQKIINSQFVSGLVLLVETVGERYAQRCERALQESSLSTATNPATILAMAEDKGYVGRRRSPSSGPAMITNKSDLFASIPEGSALISDLGVHYVTLEARPLNKGATTTVNIAQLELKVFTFYVDRRKPYFEVKLPPATAKRLHRVDVFTKSQDSGGYIPWRKTFKFRESNATSRDYTEFYNSNHEFGIRFGNGQDGYMPQLNDEIKLEVWLTEGDTTLLTGKKLKFIDDKLNSQCEIITTDTIIGGTEAADIEEIRSGALYVTQYNDEVVWKDDYTHVLTSNIGNFAFLRVWGEKEQEKEDGAPNLQNMRTVFISAYSTYLPPDRLAPKILELVDALPNMNREHRFITPTINAITITLTGSMPRTQEINEAISIVKTELGQRYGLGNANATSSEDGGDEIKEKDLWTLIDNLALFSDFKLVVNGTNNVRKLAEYRYLDTNQSVFNIGYED